ncbi:unnamed protein product [Medioppia subpectinata]|uniref:Uncharacterized protein n=1 Tax=Medioppia subpectinata TaxID=1979941 RepID=A0A7R9PWB6_9ACAR|nr:unnamed protein product [Medioppia subpectinata]CAG2103594.1 unnamed protein product [Medioppia subpectinata]
MSVKMNMLIITFVLILIVCKTQSASQPISGSIGSDYQVTIIGNNNNNNNNGQFNYLINQCLSKMYNRCTKYPAPNLSNTQYYYCCVLWETIDCYQANVQSTCTVQEQAAMGSNWNNIQMMLGGRAADLFVEILIDQVVTNPDGNQAINYLAISYLGTDLVTQWNEVPHMPLEVATL